MPTDIGRRSLRSSGAHWDRQLAVEVQQRPLRSGAGRRQGGEQARRRRRRRRRKARRAILKSNNLHLAGGEKQLVTLRFSIICRVIHFFNDCPVMSCHSEPWHLADITQSAKCWSHNWTMFEQLTKLPCSFQNSK